MEEKNFVQFEKNFAPFDDSKDSEHRAQKKLKNSSQFSFLAKDNVDAIRLNITKNKIDEESKSTFIYKLF